MKEKLKILIVDDMEVIVKNIENNLEKNEIVEVIGTAKNGQEEYDLIKKLKPDIVITDNQMPIMNGTEVIEKIIIDNEIEQKPYFIIVTADTLIEYRQQFSEKRIIGIINKSIGFDMINREIEELLDEEYQIMNIPVKEEIQKDNNNISKNQNLFAKMKNKFKKE